MSVESQIASLTSRVGRLEQDALAADVIPVPDGPYTLKIADNSQILKSTGGAGTTVTCPGGGVIRPGFTCEVWQGASGQVTIAAGSGITLHHADSLTKTRKQDSVLSIRYLTLTDVYLAGDMA